MATLTQHGLVERVSGEAIGEQGTLYRLTEEGRDIARNLSEEEVLIREGKKPAPPKSKRTEAAIQVGAAADAGQPPVQASSAS
jgi:DNA-binding MarR family transcriptional regulator